MGNRQGNDSPQQEEIIVKCEIKDMVKQFFKDSLIIWEDPDIDSPEKKPFIDQLENLCQVKIFRKLEEALIFLRETKATCHVITSTELHIEEICSAPNVSAVYLLCKNQETLVREHPKILHAEANIHNIIFKVEQNLKKDYEEKASAMFSFAPIFNETDKKNLFNFHLYLTMIPAFEDRSQAKDDFLALCKALYSDEKNLGFIDNLAQYYEEQNVLNWYTQRSLFPKVLNQCLAISSSDALQYCRLPLYDMQRNIREEYQRKSKDWSGLLYKAAYLTPEEWINIKENITKEIETIGFFSTFKDRNLALNSLQTNPDQKVLITVLVPMGPNEEEHGFVDLEFKHQPHQVIFNTMSRFTILEATEQCSQDLPIRHLVLLYGSQGFRKYVTEQKPIQKLDTENPRLISCDFCKGRVLQKSPKFFFKSFIDQSHYCQECLQGIPSTNKMPFFCVPISNFGTKVIKGCLLAYPSDLQIPFYGYQCSSCQEGSRISSYFKCTECHQLWCPNCVGNAENCMSEGHVIILERNPFSFWQERLSETELKELQAQKENIPKEDNPNKQIEMFQKTKEYKKELEYYFKLVQILDKTNLSISQRMGNLYAAIANTYIKINEHSKAIQYSLKADKIYQFIGYRTTYPNCESLLASMAKCYRYLKDYSKAEEYYLKCLEILSQVDKNNHLQQGFYYGNLGNLYSEQKQHQKAVDNLLKAFELLKKDLPNLRVCCLGLILSYFALEDYKKAEEYCVHLLDIIQRNLGEFRTHLPNCYHLFAQVYKAQGFYKKAERCCIQVLDFVHSNPEDQYNLANVYEILRDIYKTQGNYKKALEYCLKENEASKEESPEKPDHENSLGEIYQLQGQYDKALALHSKALERQRLIYAENSIQLIDTYFFLAQVYYYKGEYSKALEYSFQAIEISKEKHGGNHHLHHCSGIYWLLGKIYEKKGEYNQALEYHFKAQENLDTKDNDFHQKMGNCYCEIGNAYNHLGEYEKALEYQFKALYTTEKAFEDINKSHPNLAECWSGIGRVHCNKRDYKMAMNYHLKSLKIRKEVHGENHPDIAVCYVDIGDLYRGEGENEKAKEYYMKALEIRKLMLGDDHPETKAIQKKIEEISELNQKESEIWS